MYKSARYVYESDDAFCDHLIDEMESEIQRLGADNIAAFFAEPVMGSGGVIVPPEGYNRRTWELCKKYDILYVADEVVTGFGRLGHWFCSKDRFRRPARHDYLRERVLPPGTSHSVP